MVNSWVDFHWSTALVIGGGSKTAENLNCFVTVTGPSNPDCRCFYLLGIDNEC